MLCDCEKSVNEPGIQIDVFRSLELDSHIFWNTFVQYTLGNLRVSVSQCHWTAGSGRIDQSKNEVPGVSLAYAFNRPQSLGIKRLLHSLDPHKEHNGAISLISYRSKAQSAIPQ